MRGRSASRARCRMSDLHSKGGEVYGSGRPPSALRRRPSSSKPDRIARGPMRKSRSVHRPMTGGFIAIIAFKWLKGLAFVIFGLAALRLSRAPAMPSAVEIAKFLSVSKENELVHRVADVISNVTPRQATAAGVASLVIGLVFFVEGGFLAFRIWWSTYL